VHFDMPYLRYRHLYTHGTSAIPSLDAKVPCDYDIGVIATDDDIRIFSRNIKEDKYAECILKANVDIVVKAPGEFIISADDLPVEEYTYKNNIHYKAGYRKSRLELFMCPPRLNEGFNHSEWRIRCFTEPGRSDNERDAKATLRWQLYRPAQPNRGPLLEAGITCSVLNQWSPQTATDDVVIIRKDAMLGCITDCGVWPDPSDSICSIFVDDGLCSVSFHTRNKATRIELLPGSYVAFDRNFILAMNYSKLISAIGRYPDADVKFSRLRNTTISDRRVRIAVGDCSTEIDCKWKGPTDALREYFDVARNAQPYIMESTSLLQAVHLLRKAIYPRLHLRIHHVQAAMTIFPDMPGDKGMAIVPFEVVPMRNGILSWCVSTNNFFCMINSIRGNVVRFRPCNEGIILDEPDRPWTRHRLNCYQFEEPCDYYEKKHLECESGLLANLA